MRNSKLIFPAAAAAVGAIISIGAASAADLPARTYTKAPAMVDTAYNWTGFYVGGNAGGAWGDDPVTYTPLYSGAPAGFPAVAAANGSSTFRPTGFTAGGEAGYNWQVSRWVLGVEADIEYLDLKSSFTTPVLNFPGVVPYFFATSVKSDWMATFRPRLGYAFDRFMVYVTGGVGVANLQFAQSLTFTGAATAIGSVSSTRAGWTAGAGFEYAFAPHWSAKFEYLHSDFGSIGFTPVVSTPLINSTSSAAFRTDIARVGINYNFGGSAVVARY
jgi:outer membrane immunogenic protein